MNTISKINSYTATIDVPVTAAQAQKAVSQVSKWWALNFHGAAENKGDKFSVAFGDTFVNFQVSELIPGQKTVWYVTDCYLHWLDDKTEWKDTQVEWLFNQKGDNTTITMTHIGLVPEVECYDSCRKGWNEYVLTSLPAYIKTGKGQPS